MRSGKIKDELQEYIEKYNELVRESPVLNEKFNHTSAATVTRSLSDSGFFSASHTVNLANGLNRVEVATPEDLQAVIDKEKEKVFSDKELAKRFEAIDKNLSNLDLRRFRDYLHDHQEILAELSDYQRLREEIWCSYFYSIRDILEEFSGCYTSAKAVIEDVTKTAREEETAWKEVVDIFNERFYVPFRLIIVNQSDVILKGESPSIGFEFLDGEEHREMDRENLLSVLSQGERRALYILNILFEINARIKVGTKTLLVIDDIADSFDYRNKYAIVEYLSEISSEDIFNIIFLTHNFDFYRTFRGRLDIRREKCFVAHRDNSGVSLVEEKYRNPFKYWKTKLAEDKFLVASIPFVRNLAEYCGHQAGYLKLTSLLHYKPDTHDIKVSDLQGVIRETLGGQPESDLPGQDDKVIDKILQTAENIVAESEGYVELECKVILSMAIRLMAEKHMISVISDEGFVSRISNNQTISLINKYAEKNPGLKAEIRLLKDVNLMTPENIHLNSFMYEPLLDMSADHLYRLYGKVKALQQ